jgi:PhnB protein
MSNSEIKDFKGDAVVSPSIAPWLSIYTNMNAVEFYKSAFGAIETYRLEVPDGGLVVKLSINGAEFWVSVESVGDGDVRHAALGGDSVRMILTVAEPDAVFSQALSAGAIEIFPVAEEHGWRLGRLADPFGLHWEIGRPIAG